MTSRHASEQSGGPASKKKKYDNEIYCLIENGWEIGDKPVDFADPVTIQGL